MINTLKIPVRCCLGSMHTNISTTSETIINFSADLLLCQIKHKTDLTFMVTLTVHQTYTAQSIL